MRPGAVCSVGDMFTPEEGESEPEWVTTERKHFSEYRDLNKVCIVPFIRTNITMKSVKVWVKTEPLLTTPKRTGSKKGVVTAEFKKQTKKPCLREGEAWARYQSVTMGRHGPGARRSRGGRRGLCIVFRNPSLLKVNLFIL